MRVKRFKQRNLYSFLFHFVNLTVTLIAAVFGICLVFTLPEEALEIEAYFLVRKDIVPALATNWNSLQLRRFQAKQMSTVEKKRQETPPRSFSIYWQSFQLIFLILALIYDSLEWANKNDSDFGKKIKYWRDVVFCSMVVPYTLFVTSMFWCVYWVDRELVFPKVFDEIVPWWFNHCVHTNITVVLIIETLLQPRRHPTNKKLELSLNCAIAVAYAVVYYAIYFLTGHWLYKVFGVMTWWQVCLYQMLIWSSSYLFYILQFPINRLIHGPEDTDQHNETTTEVKDLIDSSITKETGEQEKTGNGVECNGVQEKNGKMNGVEITSMTTDLQIPPFSTKSWSLKYRTLRSQFENTKL